MGSVPASLAATPTQSEGILSAGAQHQPPFDALPLPNPASCPDRDSEHDHGGNSPYDGPSLVTTPTAASSSHAAAIAAAVEAADAAAAAGQDTVRFQLPPRPNASSGSLGASLHALPHTSGSSSGSLGLAGAPPPAPQHSASSASLGSAASSSGHHAAHHLRQAQHEQRLEEKKEPQTEAQRVVAAAQDEAEEMDELAARLAVLQSR